MEAVDTAGALSSTLTLSQPYVMFTLLPLQCVMLSFYCPSSTLTGSVAVCNVITSLRLILHLPLVFFFIRLSHTIPGSVSSLLLCRSVSLSSSLLADADCLYNALKMSWVAIQSKLLCVVML